MTRKKIIKIALILIGVSAIIGGGVVYYMFNMPHRDVQATKTDYSLKASAIVNEYFADANKANEKYLDSEGESKVLEVQGVVYDITDDFNNNKVVRLKSDEEKAGVSCTFTAEGNASVANLKKGDVLTVKGVIRSGAAFDSDLDMYEDVIMEKCSLVSK